MTIRPFERKDLKQCCDMSKRQHRESLWSHLPYDVERVKNYYLNTIGHPQFCFLVAEQDEVIIGGTACGLNQYDFSYNTYVQDLFFYVMPEYRTGSLGIKLYKAVYQWAKEKGALEVYVGYGFGKENKKMEKFYNRLGYEHHTDYYRKPVIV